MVSVTVGQEDPYEQSRLDAEAAFNEDIGAADTPDPVEVTYDAFGNEIPPGSTEEGVGAFGGEGPPIEGAKDVELTEEERTRLEAEAAFKPGCSSSSRNRTTGSRTGSSQSSSTGSSKSTKHNCQSAQ